jgi:molybdopterin molybdotransferase
MIPFDEALRTVLDSIKLLGVEDVDLEKLNGSYLAEDLIAPFPSPQFDNSAVDGYGVKLTDLIEASESAPKELRLVNSIAAGSNLPQQIKPGEAVKIFTGARVPSSCDAVVMREFSTESEGIVALSFKPSQGENIRRKGDEFEEGTVVLSSRTKVSPPVVGLIASFGKKSAKVFRKPRVGLVVTGDELVEPGQKLAPGQIYNSNVYGLKAALQELGIDECAQYLSRDTLEETKQKFQESLSASDIVISSGGVSVGDHDYVKEALESLGVKTLFWRIAMKPGKPVYFGILDEGEKRKYFFGLPGNPVSVMVTFHQIVKPAIQKMLGALQPKPQIFKAQLTQPLKKKAGRLDFVRGVFEVNEQGTLEATPTGGQESHMLSGLAKASLMIHFEASVENLEKGATVDATLINWNS